MISEFTLESIIMDLLDNLQTNESKRNKILDRLWTIVSGVNIQQISCQRDLLNTLETHNYNNVTVNIKSVIGYLNSKSRFNKPGDIIVLKGTPKYEDSKKYLERLLTNALVEKNITYDKTCGMFMDLIKFMFAETKNILDPADIIIRFKGSMAMRKVLEKNSDYDWTRTFSNSDNDASIVINPALKNFDEVFDKISDILFTRMKQMAQFYRIQLNDEILQVESQTYEVFGKSFRARNANICGFDYVKSSRFESNRKLQFGEMQNMRIQRNFINIVEYGESFELLRIKAPFSISTGKMLCGEVLDISITYKTSKSAEREFKKKSYFNQINI